MIDKNLDDEYTIEKAREYKEIGDNENAEIIYDKLWNNSNNSNPSLLYEYGEVLRGNKNSIKFIEICRKNARNDVIIKNRNIIRRLCWCIYDVYIKDFVKTEESNFDEFLKEAQFIRSNSSQLTKEKEHYNPYVLTIFKVIKVYLDCASVNYDKVLYWLDALNPNELSEKEYKFQDSDGLDREMASKKEFYYQYKTKALEKLQRFGDCIEVCEEALKSVQHFHYRNNVWIKTRLYFSRCMEADDESLEDEINNYKNLAYKENQWFMYHKLSLICWRCGKMDDALLYANKAMSCRFEYEKMNKLFQDIALLWEVTGNAINVKVYYQASAYYRNLNGWKLTEELEFAILKYNLDINNKPNIKLLQRIAMEYVKQVEGEKVFIEGTVIKVKDDYGFIAVDGAKENVYFKMKDVLNSKIVKIGNIAEFEIVDEVKGSRAKNIRIRRNKNGRSMYK